MLADQNATGTPGPAEARMREDEPGQALTADVVAAQLAAHAARLRALQEITAALAVVRAPEDVATAIMRVAAQVVGANVGGVRVLSADGTELENLPAPGYQPVLTQPILEDSLSMPSPQVDAVRSGHPVWVETPEEALSRYPELAALVMPCGIGAAISLPLRLEGRVIGTLSFGFAQPRAFTTDEREFLQMIAELTAQALERARLYSAEQGRARTAEERATRLAALQEVTAGLAAVRSPEEIAGVVMAAGSRALGAVIGLVRLLDIQGTWLEPLRAAGYRPHQAAAVERVSPDDPTPHRDVLRSGLPVWLGSVAQMQERYPARAPALIAACYQATATLPLLVGERIIGTLSFGFAQPWAFEAEERDFIAAIARLTAQALERAHLYEVEKEQTEALRKSERDFRLLAEHSTDVIVRYTPDMRLLYASPAVRQLLGFEPGDIVGRYSHEFVHPDDRPAAEQARLPIQKEGAIASATYRCLRADGTYVWVESVGRAVRDETTGEILEIQITTRDVSERKRAEDALRTLASEREAQAALSGALAEASAAMTAALELKPLHVIILEQLARVIPCDCAGILAYQDGWVVVAAGHGEPQLPAGTRIMPLGPVSLGLAKADETTMLVRDTRQDANWQAMAPWVGEHEMRSVIWLPLVVQGDTYGSLIVASRTPGFYTQQHFQAARAFAERIVQALWNARLYRLEQERARAAEHLAALRSDFLASVSHELRTPLTAMVGIGELLQEHWGKYSEGQRLERVAQIVKAANRQKQLVDDLLLVSRLEGAGLALAPETIPIAALVVRASEEVRAAYSGQAVTTEGSDALLVWADAARAVQVLVNLLDNAAKYSPEGSPVRVRWTREGDVVAVRVRDWGPGIQEEGMERLFTRFGRLQGSAIRSGRVGTGLGLYISRRLAESMGGDLTLEETGPGGSTFRLRLPVAR